MPTTTLKTATYLGIYMIFSKMGFMLTLGCLVLPLIPVRRVEEVIENSLIDNIDCISITRLMTICRF